MGCTDEHVPDTGYMAMNSVDFDNPKWRSPLTGSTKEQILVMRAKFNENVAIVNVQVVAIHAEREAERQLMLKLQADEKAADEARREVG